MPMPTMSPAVMMLGSNGSRVSSIRQGSPNVAGVAAAKTDSQRGVMTPIPKETWLGLIRKTVGAVFGARPDAVWDNCSSSESHAEELAAGRDSGWLWVNRRRIESAGEIEGNERSLPPVRRYYQ